MIRKPAVRGEHEGELVSENYYINSQEDYDNSGLEKKIRQNGGETKREFTDRIERHSHLLNYDYLEPTQEMIDKTYELTKDYHPQSIERIKAIHKWINYNIPYELDDASKSNQEDYNGGFRYKTAAETFKKGVGICFDVSLLFQSMAIISGNHITRVVQDKNHIYNSHGFCKSSAIYIDCTRYDGFGITPEKEHAILESHQLERLYNLFCKNFNDGEVEKACTHSRLLLNSILQANKPDDFKPTNRPYNYHQTNTLPPFNTIKVLPYAALITGLSFISQDVRDFTRKAADEITYKINQTDVMNLTEKLENFRELTEKMIDKLKN